MNKQLNILLIGGNSFIAQQFISSNNNFFKIHSAARRTANIKNETIISDLFNLPESVFKNIDVVINLAAIVHQPKIQDKNIYEQINYRLPLFLANMAIKNDCQHFIQISTIAVYGKTTIINKNTACSPVNYYGEYKLKADLELAKLTSENFTVTSLRPSMVYGSSHSPGNLNSLIKLVKTSFPLPFGGIDNKRQFLNVNNLTQAIKGIILNNIGGIVILADQEHISTLNLINTISKALNQKNKIVSFNLFWKIIRKIKPGIAHKLIDNLEIENSHSFSELGIEEIYSIEDGIKEMVFLKRKLKN